jgi:hypothetical protein
MSRTVNLPLPKGVSNWLNILEKEHLAKQQQPQFRRRSTCRKASKPINGPTRSGDLVAETQRTKEKDNRQTASNVHQVSRPATTKTPALIPQTPST